MLHSKNFFLVIFTLLLAFISFNSKISKAGDLETRAQPGLLRPLGPPYDICDRSKENIDRIKAAADLVYISQVYPISVDEGSELFVEGLNMHMIERGKMCFLLETPSGGYFGNCLSNAVEVLSTNRIKINMPPLARGVPRRLPTSGSATLTLSINKRCPPPTGPYREQHFLTVPGQVYFTSAPIAPVDRCDQKPTPPRNWILRAASFSHSSINLAWADATNEVGYRIEKRVKGTTRWFLGALARPDASAIAVDNLDPGTTYEFQVQGKSNCKETKFDTPYSPIVEATTLPLGIESGTATLRFGDVTPGAPLEKPGGTEIQSIRVIAYEDHNSNNVVDTGTGLNDLPQNIAGNFPRFLELSGGFDQRVPPRVHAGNEYMQLSQGAQAPTNIVIYAEFVPTSGALSGSTDPQYVAAHLYINPSDGTQNKAVWFSGGDLDLNGRIMQTPFFPRLHQHDVPNLSLTSVTLQGGTNTQGRISGTVSGRMHLDDGKQSYNGSYTFRFDTPLMWDNAF